MVAGDFNKWNANELVMEKNGDSWERQLYLSDGKHDYRFLVDGKWITDPGNLVKEVDESNNINSVIKLGETIQFKLNGYADAKQVSIAGDFNSWKPGELSLAKTQDSWVLSLVLPAGNYGYKFIVDGKWVADPLNQNSVTGNGETNSFLSARPNHVFKLKGFKGAKTIRLSGTFDNWDENGYTLAHKGDEWTISLYLKPGKYLYKFIVDGQWIIDPGNKLWEQNQQHTGNSVLWIE
jgi:1,4-alpha-glucan branching enzyme